jgi:hypothetical protein
MRSTIYSIPELLPRDKRCIDRATRLPISVGIGSGLLDDHPHLFDLKRQDLIRAAACLAWMVEAPTSSLFTTVVSSYFDCLAWSFRIYAGRWHMRELVESEPPHILLISSYWHHGHNRDDPFEADGGVADWAHMLMATRPAQSHEVIIIAVDEDNVKSCSGAQSAFVVGHNCDGRVMHTVPGFTLASGGPPYATVWTEVIGVAALLLDRRSREASRVEP